MMPPTAAWINRQTFLMKSAQRTKEQARGEAEIDAEKAVVKGERITVMVDFSSVVKEFDGYQLTLISIKLGERKGETKVEPWGVYFENVPPGNHKGSIELVLEKTGGEKMLCGPVEFRIRHGGKPDVINLFFTPEDCEKVKVT